VQTIKYVYWQEDDAWLGYLEEYPDYWTQGESFDDLLEHLKDLFLDLSGGQIPAARRVGELVVPHTEAQSHRESPWCTTLCLCAPV
jgi:predicted RNase H-like HicB family nuclease